MPNLGLEPTRYNVGTVDTGGSYAVYGYSLREAGNGCLLQIYHTEIDPANLIWEDEIGVGVKHAPVVLSMPIRAFTGNLCIVIANTDGYALIQTDAP